MSQIEANLKELCRAKGLSLTDVANRIGTSPSNLVNRIKGNPTLSTLEDIAGALNISVTELMTLKPEKAQGVAIIDGKTYQISLPGKNAVQLPQYDRYDQLRKDITAFVKSSIKEEKCASLMGMLESFEVFSLFFDSQSNRFLLSLCYADGKILTATYDKFEFCDWKDDDTEETVKWNLADVTEDIINDIEGRVPQQLNSL